MSTHGGSNHAGMLAGLMTIMVGCVSAPLTADDGLGDASESSHADEPPTGTGTETDSGTTAETGTETDDGDDFNACVTAEGTLGLGALLLEPGEDRAWVIDGADLLELELTGPPGSLVELHGAARGNRIVIARHLGYEGECWEDACKQPSIIQAFDRNSGELQWAREVNGELSGGLSTGDDGWITGNYISITEGWLEGFAMNDDQSIMLPDHWIAGPVTVVDGRLAAVERQQHMYGWLALADQSWTPVQPPPLDSDHVQVAEDDSTLEYVAEQGLGHSFVRATPDQVDVFELPVDPLTSSLANAGSAGRFRLLRTYDYDDPSAELVVRIDVESGEVIVVDYPEPPAGWTWFDCPSRQIALTPQGALLYVLRDFASVRVWAFAPESEQWSEVGLPVGPVEFLHFQFGVGDVHFVKATAPFADPACPTSEWGDPPADALPGQSLQLVRYAPPLALALPLPKDVILPWWVMTSVVDEQERCVAYVDEETQWRVRALEGEGEGDFGPALGPWIWLD